MERLSVLAIMAALSICTAGCGAAKAPGQAPAVLQASFRSLAVSELPAFDASLPKGDLKHAKVQPFRLKQGLVRDDAQANAKFVRVKKLALEAIAESNKRIAEFNRTGEPRHIVEADSPLVRGLNMIVDVLDGDQDPTAGKVVAVVEKSGADANQLMEDYKKTFFKSDAKWFKMANGILEVHGNAIERIHDIMRVATETE